MEGTNNRSRAESNIRELHCNAVNSNVKQTDCKGEHEEKEYGWEEEEDDDEEEEDKISKKKKTKRTTTQTTASCKLN